MGLPVHGLGAKIQFVRQRHGRRRIHLIAAFLSIAAASGCADTTATDSHQPVVTTPRPPAGQVYVMEPVWRANESGNIGRDFRTINAEVTA